MNAKHHGFKRWGPEKDDDDDVQSMIAFKKRVKNKMMMMIMCRARWLSRGGVQKKAMMMCRA